MANIGQAHNFSDSRQVLSGDEIDATFDAAGKVDFLEARQDAQMILGADQTLRFWNLR